MAATLFLLPLHEGAVPDASAAGPSLVWRRTYGGPDPLADSGSDVAVARSGAIYVAGAVDVHGQQRNVLLRKYAPRGGVFWTRSDNGTASEYDVGSGVAVAADGSVYVSGTTDVGTPGAGPPSRRLLLQKYSEGGALAWTRTFNGGDQGLSYGSAVAVAKDGNVYVTGNFAVTGKARNLVLRKYSPGGRVL